jgi:hypothetical protein
VSIARIPLAWHSDGAINDNFAISIWKIGHIFHHAG